MSDKIRGAGDSRVEAKSESSKAQSRKEPIVIKKYANRRLYNTDTSTYVTLDDLAKMVRAERDFVVFDAKTGEELTHTVLTQIIVEQEGRGSSLLPVPFLRQLIRFYGDNMGAFVPSYLQMSMENLTRDQERYRTQFGHLFTGKTFPPVPFGTAGFETLQAQVRQNVALFERALGLFTPFQPGPGGQIGPGGSPTGSQIGTPTGSPTGSPNGAEGSNGSVPSGGDASPLLPSPEKSNASAGPSASSPSELAELKAQMQAMQAKLERMANAKG